MPEATREFSEYQMGSEQFSLLASYDKKIIKCVIDKSMNFDTAISYPLAPAVGE